MTAERVSLREGLLSKSLNEIFLADVRNVRTWQGPLQRLTRVGNIGIASSGGAGMEIKVRGLPDPMRVKALVEAARRAEVQPLPPSAPSGDAPPHLSTDK